MQPKREPLPVGTVVSFKGVLGTIVKIEEGAEYYVLDMHDPKFIAHVPVEEVVKVEASE